MRPIPISRRDFDAIKTYAEFDLPEDQCPSQEGRKHIEWIMDVLQMIVTALRAGGHEVTAVKGYRSNVGYACRLGRCCEIQMFLGLQRKRAGWVSCGLRTRWGVPLLLLPFERWAMPTSNCARQWMRFRGSIDEVLGTLGATSVVWFTEKEADASEAVEDVES